MNKSVLMIMIIALVGGSIVGLAMIGTINIPGLTPVKKKKTAALLYEGDKEADLASAAKLYSGDKEKPVVEPAKELAPIVSALPPKAKDKPAFVIAPDVGRKKIAKLWNEMSVDSLQKMIDEFKGPDLPKILAIMDPAKVAKLLEKMEPVKAAKLSKDIQSEASKVKAPA